MTRIILILSLFVAATLALVAPPSSTIRRPNQRTAGRRPTSDAFRLSAIRRTNGNNNNKNNNNNNDDGDASSKSALRQRIFGILFPVTVALSANAPFLYVIANPPSPEEREVMLMDFCKGDVCTLLGGGSGFGGGDKGGESIGLEIAQAMPSVEDFEAMARTAAEVAMGVDIH